MTLKVAIAAVIVLLLGVIVVYPMFAPHPPVIDERELVEPVVPIIVPEPTPIPEPDIGTLPPAPPLPPTQPFQEQPGGAGGPCDNGVCPTQEPQSNDGGLFWRLRARRGR
jgi:hypothetical protein